MITEQMLTNFTLWCLVAFAFFLIVGTISQVVGEIRYTNPDNPGRRKWIAVQNIFLGMSIASGVILLIGVVALHNIAV